MWCNLETDLKTYFEYYIQNNFKTMIFFIITANTAKQEFYNTEYFHDFFTTIETSGNFYDTGCH